MHRCIRGIELEKILSHYIRFLQKCTNFEIKNKIPGEQSSRSQARYRENQQDFLFMASNNNLRAYFGNTLKYFYQNTVLFFRSTDFYHTNIVVWMFLRFI